MVVILYVHAGPNSSRILTNCPTIAAFCNEDGGIGRIDALVAKCQVIADEMVEEKITIPVN